MDAFMMAKVCLRIAALRVVAFASFGIPPFGILRSEITPTFRSGF